MTWTERGIVQNGSIHFAKPLLLPDGTEVEVRIEPTPETTSAENHVAPAGPPDDFAKPPYFGTWADREDIADSAARVRRGREQWHQRAPTPTRCPL